MNGIRLILQIIAHLCILLSFCMIISAITIPKWWRLNVKQTSNEDHVNADIGLWERCHLFPGLPKRVDNCMEYNDVLKFSGNRLNLGINISDIIISPFVADQKDFDVMLLLGIIQSALVFICILSAALSIVLRTTNHSRWKKCQLIALFIGVLAGLVGLAAQIFGEIKFRKEWLPSNNAEYKYKHGISVILAWLSAILSLLASLLIGIIIRCLKGK